MKIDLTRLGNADLARLIRDASALLAGRLDESVHVVRRPAVEKVVIVDEPPAEEKDYCLRIKGLLQSGQYIKADERRRVAEIAEKYAAWVSRQGLPTTSNTGPWRASGQFLGQRRAREV